MGTELCKQSTDTRSMDYQSGDGKKEEKVLEEMADFSNNDTVEMDDHSSPLKKFINSHPNVATKGASNGLPFQSPKSNIKAFAVKAEVIKPPRHRASISAVSSPNSPPKKNNRPRCSIDIVDIQQFQATVKDYVVTEKHMGDSFGRIEINQQKFIHLRNQDPKKYYRFDQSIGQGAYGSVFKAYCLKTNEKRAIKIIKKQNLGRGKKDEVFAELQLLKKMDHSNIIKLYEVFEFDNRYQVVMEYCNGGSFIDFIKSRNTFDQNVIKVILKQLLGCLNYLHAIKTVHRDLKLQNVVFIRKYNKQMAADDIQIKLLDFGTAFKMIKHKVRCNQLVGTVSYMPPQIIKGYFTAKCDLWSCGVIFYILLTSKSPFRCKRKEDTLQKILNHEIKLNDRCWDEVSQPAKDLLLRLLEKDPEKRISAADALKHPWFDQNKKQKGMKNSGFMNQLSNYYRQNNLISVLESYLVFSKVSQEQRKRINTIFKELDTNLDGFIEKNELIQAFKDESQGEINLDEVQYMISKIDKDNSGCISLSQFTSAMIDKQKLWAQNALEEAFDYFDTNKTGFFQMNQLASILAGSDNEEIQSLFIQLDANHDNKISKEEFISYLLKQGCLY